MHLIDVENSVHSFLRIGLIFSASVQVEKMNTARIGYILKNFQNNNPVYNNLFIFLIFIYHLNIANPKL